MDTVKIGKLIAESRKETGLTQRELGEQLHVSDRAVSKWERGLNLPDAALFEPLCGILGLTLAELFRGERRVAEIPALEQATVEAVSLADKREKDRRKYKHLAALLAVLLLLAGYLLGRPLYRNWKLQKSYDRDDAMPGPYLEYASGYKNVHITLLPHGMHGPFESGEGMISTEEAAAWLPKEPAHLCLYEITEPQVSFAHLYFCREKSQMEIKILRWPYDGTSGQSFETGENVTLHTNQTERYFQVEKSYLYSVVVSWGNGYYAEYPFLVR